MGMKKAIESLDMELDLFTSDNAEDAKEIIIKHQSDLIITDIMFPGITGLDLIEQVVNNAYHPKVIVVSGFYNFDYGRRSIRFGAIDYLLKPYSTEEFTEKVSKALQMIKEENE